VISCTPLALEDSDKLLPLLPEDAHRPGDFIRSDAFPDVLHALHDLLEAKTFRGAYPLQTQPLGTQAEFLHLFPYPFDAPLRPVVGVDMNDTMKIIYT
jgi:hypothetical protein